ncbi:hypothetical protein [Achromobacter xylosoxidans]|uniref:hypothetical protein n=1 Tax=Alcaligenes xylosoxydans xylosoxydans TaxID=85698 RepID=UPI00292F36B3|nr:hypothetical protein [Achromobacter xylosoxidans]WOB74090.1 hypothetical protein PZA07_01005 [Achromobacter xylosoxidans]
METDKQQRSWPAYAFAIVLAVALLTLLYAFRSPICSWYLAKDCNGRDFMEGVYFLMGGPLLFAAAVVGLQQLKLAKQSLQLTRVATQQVRTIEEAKFSTDVARYFIDEVIRTFDGVATTLTRAKTATTRSTLHASRIEICWYGIATESAICRDRKVVAMSAEYQHALNQLDLFASMVRVYPSQERQLYQLCSGAFFSCVGRALPVIYAAKRRKGNPVANLESLILRWIAVSQPSLLISVGDAKYETHSITTVVQLENHWQGHPAFRLHGDESVSQKIAK